MTLPAILESKRALSSTPVTAQQQSLPLLFGRPRCKKPTTHRHCSTCNPIAACSAAAAAAGGRAARHQTVHGVAAVLQPYKPQLLQQQHRELHQQQQRNSSRHKAACSAAAAVEAAGSGLLHVDATPFIGPIQVVNIEGGSHWHATASEGMCHTSSREWMTRRAHVTG